MSKKSSVNPPRVIKTAEQIAFEAKHKEEFAKQKEILNANLLPALRETATNIIDAKALIIQAVETLQDAFQAEIVKEQSRLSSISLEELKIEAKDHNKRAVKLLEAVKGQRTGLVLALLNSLNVLVEVAESKKNQDQLFKDLDVKL